MAWGLNSYMSWWRTCRGRPDRLLFSRCLPRCPSQPAECPPEIPSPFGHSSRIVSPLIKYFPERHKIWKKTCEKYFSVAVLCIFEKAVVGSLKLFENSSELCLGMGGRAREQLGIKSWIRIIFVCSLPAAVLDWQNKQVLLGTNRR